MQLQGQEDNVLTTITLTHTHTHNIYACSVLWGQPVMADAGFHLGRAGIGGGGGGLQSFCPLGNYIFKIHLMLISA